MLLAKQVLVWWHPCVCVFCRHKNWKKLIGNGLQLMCYGQPYLQDVGDDLTLTITVDLESHFSILLRTVSSPHCTPMWENHTASHANTPLMQAANASRAKINGSRQNSLSLQFALIYILANLWSSVLTVHYFYYVDCVELVHFLSQLAYVIVHSS